ncbi:MAG: KH domain-containing protein [Ruminococcaceae bacterium]|jgi:spoIIIJ-associated protein|nr:KH domain-containing protein [Oscillospiraceae bacterium]
MERTYIATGKTIDLAIQAALEALSMDRDSVSVEVLENAKSGFLGIGASPAKVKVTYEVPDETNKASAALSSASRSKPKKEKPQAPAAKVVDLPKAEKPRVTAPLPVAEAPKAEKPRRDRREKNRAKDEPRAPKQEKPRQEKPKAEPKEYAPAAPGSMEERIEQFIQGLLGHMGSDAVPHCVKTDEDSYLVELVGDNLGMLIGRRGETLDAIQHLTNYTINRDASKRSRINVDAESYRAKREESLRRHARKVAGKVVRYRRNITLEPMNAYERHVIHATLQDTDDISTFSTGTEPNRRVVVSYNRYKNADQEKN